MRTICDALGSAGNEGMLFLVDEVEEEGDLEIAWKTEAEKEQQWKRITEILELAEDQKEEEEADD